jgi:hypothetical protein
MTSHVLLLVLFSFFVSIVFAVLLRDDAKSQAQLGGIVFGGFVLSAVLLGWVMYPFPL